MKNEEKIELLAEIMGVESEDVSLDMLLSDFEEWDSLAALSLMSVLYNKFHKRITPADVKQLRTIDDVLNLME